MSAVQGTRIRFAVWALHLVLPMLGLWLLLTQPQLDVHWQHDPSHFWMVLGVAGVNVLLGARINEASRRRRDARLFLVSLAFLASAMFLFLHALATPGVLLDGVSAGFTLATPFGLVVASVFAVLSGLPFTPEGSATVVRRQGLLRGGLGALGVGWAAASLLELPPLASVPEAGDLDSPLIAVMGMAAGLYLYAAWRYWRLHRARPAVMLVSLVTAWVLLAEASVTVVFAPSWQLSWWEWHLLMTFAYGYVAYSARVQYREEGPGVGLFDGIALEQTVQRVRADYGRALESFVEVLQRQAATGGVAHETELVLAGLAKRFDLTEGQVRVLGRAGEALAGERDQVRRLDALVAIGTQTRVVTAEADLLRNAVGQFAASLGADRLRVGLVTEGRLAFPPELATTAGWTAAHDTAAGAVLEEIGTATLSDVTAVVDAIVAPPAAGDGAAGDGIGAMVLPLMVKQHLAGVLQVARPRGAFGERDRALLRSLASQLSIALENTRLYRQIDVLFRQYMSPDVATSLLADPEQARLGGQLVEVTALFADLRGFTTYSERVEPAQIMGLLNRYHAVTVPRVLAEGGTVVQFVGDALMALFNAPARQPDHALRAARCALSIQRAIDEIIASGEDPGPAVGPEGWPRFRIGINTGMAVVGNVGSERLRNFNAHGDAVNVAARLESVAEPGQVVIGAATRDAIGEDALVRPLGELTLKGKREPVPAYMLTALRGAGADRTDATGPAHATGPTDATGPADAKGGEPA